MDRPTRSMTIGDYVYEGFMVFVVVILAPIWLPLAAIGWLVNHILDWADRRLEARVTR